MAKQGDFLHSPQAEQLLRDKQRVTQLMHSTDAQTLLDLLQQKGGSNLQQAAQAAMEGRPEALVQLVQRVVAQPEGARAAEKLQKQFSK